MRSEKEYDELSRKLQSDDPDWQPRRILTGEDAIDTIRNDDKQEKPLHVRIPTELHQKLEVAAKNDHRSKSSYVRHILERAVSKER